MSHTPGPWKICAYCYDRDEASPTGRRVRLTSCSDDAEGFLVLSANGTITELPSHRREADARLIAAAAPELLAALELFVRCIQQYERDDNDLATLAETIESYEAFEIAISAIAKATGVQS